MRIPYRLLAPLPLLLAAAPASPTLMPGLWEQTRVTVLDTVNGSADIAEHMQGALPKPAPRRDCYNAADLADPRTIRMDMGDGRCSFSRFTMIDGRISAAGDCAAGGETMHVEGSGNYSATGYDFAFTGTGHAGRLDLGFRGRDSGRRIAECPMPAARGGAGS
jgi:hypothetical protein